MSSIGYRPEVDGLRGIAVMAVIFYHAGFSAVSGGFIGVDIFYVISGYLITKIIYPEVTAGQFSFVKFYERRVRRILPALFVVLFATTLATLFVLTPDQLNDYGQSLMAVILFLSNHFFYSKTGYFSSNADEVPLLHTWSLAVEEQFYLFFPILLIAIMRFWPLRTRWVLSVLLLLSMVLCLWRTNNNQATLSFFSATSRVWELLLGALLAIQEIAHGPTKGKASWTGLGLLMAIIPAFLYSADSQYPGWLTTIPVFGTFLILKYAQPNHRLGLLLASRPLVQIGLISYSAYLWHQPLFALSFHLTGTRPSLESRVALISLTLCIAYLSWRVIEAPFRNPSRVSVLGIWSGALVGSLVLLTVGFIFQFYAGMPGRFSSVDFKQFQPINLPAEDRHCRAIVPGLSENCLASMNVEKGGPIDLLFLGDSHSQAFAAGVIDRHPELRVLSIGRDGCLPFVGVERYDMKEKINCGEAFKYLEAHHSTIKKIVLVGRYSYYAEGSGFGEIDNAGRRPGSIHIQPAGFAERVDVQSYSEVMATGLKDTIDELNMRSKLYFVHQVPELGFDPKDCIDFGARFKRHKTCTIPRVEVMKRQSKYRVAVDQVLVSYPEVTVVDPLNTLCGTESCSALLSDKVLYRDDDHISIEGVGLLSKNLL